MNGWRFAVFLSIVLSIWVLMHLYVFWRLRSVLWVARHLAQRWMVLTGVALGSSYVVARNLNSFRIELIGVPLEYVGAAWMGVMFLVFTSVLLVDVVTLGGWMSSRLTPVWRGWAAMVALGLSLVALVQGLRPPVIQDYEITMEGLPQERDGMAMVVVSDLHLGTLIGKRWLAALVKRINDLRPDLVVVAGDAVDGDAARVEPLLPLMRGLRAPLGVWAVTGNHEFYAGVERCVRLFEAANWKVLRDGWAMPTPGLVVAGVDDLTARRQSGPGGDAVRRAMESRPPGATVLVSHTPWMAERGAAAGGGLMVSGHTHNGQIWPFNWLVGTRYPLLGGRYEVGGMAVIVCRGTGTWGPRMRLWRPSEIIRVRLRSGEPPGQSRPGGAVGSSILPRPN